MSKIKNVVFDFGGVLVHLNRDQAVKRFEEIGVKDAEQLIDPYEQKGVFLELENGKITAEEFCEEISKHAGRPISFEEAEYAWLGFVVEVPQEKLDYVMNLREKYNVYLLSNTNPMIQHWARNDKFSDKGSISNYFDKLYCSYEMGLTKPSETIFEAMLKDSGMKAEETLFIDDGASNVRVAEKMGFNVYKSENKEDWRGAIDAILA
jgi:putative hydrolase of the HAD superfamily